MITDKELNEIADFVVHNCDGLYDFSDRPYIAQYASVHANYGTIMVVKDEGEIVAVCRWNMVTPSHARVLDLIVRPDFRNKNLVKSILLQAKMAMPRLETISFHRKKYAMRTSEHLVNRWLKENIWVEANPLK